MSKDIVAPKVAIIGTGRMGRRHISVVRELGLDLVGVVDQSSEAVALAARECGVPPDRQFSDTRVLFENTRPDLVVIATTAPSHCALTIEAAESRVGHILCEKPMAVSLEQCDRMLEACERNGAALAINLPARFASYYTEPKAIIESEEFGGLTSVTIVAGNVGMAMNGTHFFEMFRYISGEEIKEVTAWFSEGAIPNPRGREFEDRAGSLRLLTDGGKRFYMEAGSDQGHGVQIIYSGPYGQLRLDFDGTLNVVVRQEQGRHLPTTNYAGPEVTSKHSTQSADVLAPTAAVLRALMDENNYPTGADGRAAVAVLVAAYVSNENGHVSVRMSDVEQHRKREFAWA